MEKTLYLSGDNGYTAKIQDAINRTKHEFIYIGLLLCEVDSFEYYKEAGFENVYDYCEVTFGFKRSSTNNFMRVYRRFGEAMSLKEAYKHYSYSQLTEMCSMNGYQLSQCKPEYSVQKLRDLKRGNPSPDRAAPTSLSVQTSGFDKQGDVGVSICEDHYTALDLYIADRFSGRCNYESAIAFMNAVKNTGCDFKMDIKSGVHSTIYRVSIMFEMDGAHIKLNGVPARVSPAGCFYILRRKADKENARICR